MHGTGAPLATPFAADGTIDHDALAELADWLLDSGLDFLVPAGSTSEAPLLSRAERTAVVETVAAASGDTPVIAGTGHPGYDETMAQTEAAADAGADAALVVTPFYYDHDQDALREYYRDVADASPIPVYLYSVPKFTHMAIEPETAVDLAGHENVAGMKDSSGNMEAVQRIATGTGEDFDLLVGAGSIYAPGLDAGASGGILALANVVPELASEIYDRHVAGTDEQARALNRRLVALNRAVTSEHGIPGLKAAMAYRDVPVGTVRRPLRPVDESTRRDLHRLLDAVLP